MEGQRKSLRNECSLTTLELVDVNGVIGKDQYTSLKISNWGGRL